MGASSDVFPDAAASSGEGRHGRAGIAVAAAAAVAAGLGGWAVAQAGMKGILVAVGALAFSAVMVRVRARRELALAGMVCCLAFLLHKSLGPIADNVASGPPSVYVTTLDVMLAVLYGLWVAEGTFLADLRSAVRQPLFWILPAGALVTSVSVLGAPSPALTLAELVRMAWIYALFVYLAVRLRTPRQVWIVLAGLGAVSLVELGVVVMQWRTGGVLGLSFLGVPTTLGERTLDDGSLGRPFGTVTHPVFMGALLASIALMALSVGLTTDRRRVRIACLAAVPVALVPLLLANTRAALVAFAAGALVPLVHLAARRRLSLRWVGAVGVAACLAAVVFWPAISGVIGDSFGTDHFKLEVESRSELNHVALDMFRDAPLIGHGLNNFQKAMGPYEQRGLIFADNPVHNLYLLQLAETGFAGLAVLALVGGAVALLAVRLARARDRLYSGVGVGLAAVLVFFALEELLGFSLRQDAPRSLFWILVGLAAACARMAGAEAGPKARAGRPGRPARTLRPERGPRVTERVPSRARAALSSAAGRLRGRASRPVALIAAASMIVGGAAGFSQPTPRPSTEGLAVLFAAVDRATGRQSIYRANGDGTGIERLSPDDGRDYSWPEWAMGGTKIVYTARAGQAGIAEDIYMMDPDGSHEVRLTFNPWRNAQPKVSPDGRTVLFTSSWGEFPEVALFELDLATSQVRNVSAVASTRGGFDSDPRWSPDGRSIVFANSEDDGVTIPTQIEVMDAGGTGRRRLTNDRWYGTDPAFSPDGREVAIASYRGEGNPSAEGEGADGSSVAQRSLEVKLSNWHLVVTDVATGAERVLTDGAFCAGRKPSEACTPKEASAVDPLWTPDGAGIGFISALSTGSMCICLVDRDGGQGRVVVESSELAITWFDWVVPGEAPSTAVTPAPHGNGNLLFTGKRDGAPVFELSGPDRWGSVPLPAGGLTPTSVRWTPDRSRIVFTAKVPVNVKGRPKVAAGRQVHFTLDFMDRLVNPPLSRPEVAEEQVFVMDAGGANLRQLTFPWTEDPLDALPDGELRGNVDPDVSPDGRYVVFTNVSSTTLESSVLRLDLNTGDVMSLTNATSGAVPVRDETPRFSPDGTRVAFASAVGGTSQIHVMEAGDGRRVVQLTNDNAVNVSPAWSPDGRSIVFTSYRGDGDVDPVGTLAEALTAGKVPLKGWVLVRFDVATGKQLVLTPPEGSPALAPVFSPDGASVAYISVSDPGQPDVYVVPSGGGRPRPLQVTVRTNELFLDWR